MTRDQIIERATKVALNATEHRVAWSDAHSAATAIGDMIAGEVEALQAECLEQARLNGMGAEREAALMAQVEALQAENARLRTRLAVIRDSYDMRAELYTNDADCAGNLADHARAALTTQEKPMTDLKTEWERRADLEAEERRMKQIKEADAGKKR